MERFLAVPAGFLGGTAHECDLILVVRYLPLITSTLGEETSRST
jgi:hypothetical protein